MRRSPVARPPASSRPRPPRTGGGAGPLAVAGLALLVLVVLGVVVRPLAVDAFASFAADKDSLLRQDAVREIIAAQLAPDAALAADPKASARPFVVRKGETLRGVAARLADAGLVRSALAFTLAAYDEGRADAIQAGTYQVSPAQTPREIARLLDHAPGEQTVLRVIEGWRLTEIAAAVAKAFPGVSADAFLKAAVVGDRKDPLLSGLAPSTPLEGFLFPDTYYFRPGASAGEIVDGLFATFRDRAGAALLGARGRGLGVAELVTLASIVEREAQDRAESPTIAGVYANRLKIGMKLDADPTVQYALGDWGELSLKDLETASPYNTYRVAGLPPTPICSPGLAAIGAAIAPAEHTYLFFVAKSDGTGGHAFARTIEEQEANRVKYGNR